MQKRRKISSILILLLFMVAACSPPPPTATPEPTPLPPTAIPTETPIPTPTTPPVDETDTEAFQFDTSDVVAAGELTFYSTQFNAANEGDRFRQILEESGYDFLSSDSGPLLSLLLREAGTEAGTVDVVAMLHGDFPGLMTDDVLVNLSPVLDSLGEDRVFAPAFVELGRLNTDDYQYYIPWMQATYIMAAHTDALEYLPDEADINALAWEQLAEWCKNIFEETGEARCGFPHAGLFHRLLQGYLYPSFTGGMVTEFRSEAAVEMYEFMREDLWPFVIEQSLDFAFMQDPLIAGDVWIAFDHTARLISAFEREPRNFVAFPAPAGPVGRGYMPVVVGLGIPKSAVNSNAAVQLIDYLTSPEIQRQVLDSLAFFPIVSGVNTRDLPRGIAIEASAVESQAIAEDALPALLPVGLGDRDDEINQIYRNAFDRIVLDGEEINVVLAEEGENLQTLLDETGAACWQPDPPSDGACQVK